MKTNTTIEDLSWSATAGMERFWTYRAPKGACDWCPGCGFAASCMTCRAPVGMHLAQAY